MIPFAMNASSILITGGAGFLGWNLINRLSKHHRVIGTFHPGLQAQCRRKGVKTLYVYPLRVTTVLKKWPEMAWRKREVLPVSQALKMIRDPALAQCVQRLSARLVA